MNAKLQLNRWIPHGVLVLSAVLSAWLAPLVVSGWAAAANEPPAQSLPAGLNGRTLLRSGEPLRLWAAGVPEPLKVEWRLNGRWVGSASALTVERVPDGDHTLQLTYRDAAGQGYALTTVVRVVPEEQYALLVTAIQAAITLPLWEEDEPVYLPLVER